MDLESWSGHDGADRDTVVLAWLPEDQPFLALVDNCNAPHTDVLESTTTTPSVSRVGLETVQCSIHLAEQDLAPGQITLET